MADGVHLTKCKDYDVKKLRKQMKEHLDLYLDLKKLKGKKVLLKINLLSPSDPGQAVITHPKFLQALIEELNSRGAKCLIADSPGGPFNPARMEKAYARCGYDKVAKKTGAKLLTVTTSSEVKFKKGKFVKSFLITDYLKEADIVIAVPKLKTHMFMGLTLCTKIMFGAIPGTTKVTYHTRFPEPINFAKMLCDLTELTHPDLFIVDGVVGMDKQGPGSSGRPRKVGLIASGRNYAEVDVVCARSVGLDFDGLPIMEGIEAYGKLKLDSKIPVTGNGKGYKLKPPYVPARTDHMMRRLPGFLNRFQREIASPKPVINRNKCIGCGICRQNCAGDAIKIVSKKAQINKSKCIRCYCCHELCPETAVDLKRGLINL